MKTILIVDDEPAARYGLRRALEAKYRIAEADSAEGAREALVREQPDLVLLDVVLPGQDGLSFLRWMREQGSELPVLMVSALDTAKTAVEALQIGAADYLVKGFELEELRQRVANLLKLATLEKENDALKRRLTTEGQFGQMIGRSAEMRRAFEMADRVAATDSTVLILGESGTGKTMTARAIHQMSSRADKPFVEVACGALPDTLLESELFGHVAGSFTGAVHDKIGKFLQADGGTIFLDEIATSSPSLQVKLLRVLQDREFEPVGGTKTHKVDIRLILATNCDLEELVAKGEFRQDLYYRINVITLMQPPLRERIGDIPLLAQHYLEDFCKQTGKNVTGFNEQALQILQRYQWPGNVRELVNVVERAIVLTKRNVIGIEDFPEALRRGATVPDALQSSGGGANLKAALANPERQIILDALENNGWNRQNTAEMLGINRTTLYKKMKKYGIEFEKQLI